MTVDWKIWAGVLAIILAIGAWLWIGQLRAERDLWALRTQTLTRENASLAASARVIGAAAQAQNMVCQTEIIRRERIVEITETKPAIKPEGAADAGASKKAVDLLNHDLFTPLGHGLRRAAE